MPACDAASLNLTLAPKRRKKTLKWTDDTVDNEGMGKKKSKSALHMHFEANDVYGGQTPLAMSAPLTVRLCSSAVGPLLRALQLARRYAHAGHAHESDVTLHLQSVASSTHGGALGTGVMTTTVITNAIQQIQRAL